MFSAAIIFVHHSSQDHEEREEVGSVSAAVKRVEPAVSVAA
jgi:hypothetical protein